MNTETLTEALRRLDAPALSWTFALYSTRKSRDGIMLEWNLCAMKGAAVQAGWMREHLLKKPVAEKPVAAYSPFLSDKENIGHLAVTDALIQEQLSDILTDIRGGQAYAPEDFLSGVLPKPTGYALYGTAQDEGGQMTAQVLLMRRGNPFLASSATRLFMGDADEIAPCDKPVLKLSPAVDFLMLDDGCYFLSSAIQKDFAMENRHFAIAQKRMALIAEAEIVSDYEQLEQVVMTTKNARKFLDFDREILAHIMDLSIPLREEFLSTYGVTTDQNGRMDTSDPEQCELIVDLLCVKSCLDPLGRLSVGKGITPRD